MSLTKPRRGRRQAGSVTLEYLGLAALAVVLLTVSIIAIQGSSWQDGVRSVQCEVLASGCGASVPGGNSAGGSGGGSAGGGSPGGAVIPISTQPPPAASGCTTWLGCAAAGVGNGLLNFGKALLDDVVGFFELLRDPSKIIDALRYIWNNPRAAALGLVWDAESAAMWAEGDISGALGRTLYNGGSLVVPGVNLGKLGVLADLGRLGRTAGIVEETAQLARRAQEAARAGNLDEAADLAAQAQQRADDAADNARRAGCLSAGEVPDSQVLAMAGPHRMAVTLVRPAAPLVLSSPCGRAADAAAEAQRQADSVESIRRPRRSPEETAGRGGPDNNRVGSEAAAAIASRYPGARTEVTYNLPNSTRRLDVLTPDGRAIESKVGYTALNERTRKEIADDAEIMQRVRNGEGGVVSSVEWVFTPAKDGSLGPNTALRQALDDAGIPYRLEPNPPVAVVPPPRGSPE